MIIRYDQEIAYWRMINTAAVRLDFTGVDTLAEEFFYAMEQKLCASTNPDEKKRIRTDISQLLQFREKNESMREYMGHLEEMEKIEDQERREDNSGEEWKNNG